MNWKDKQPDLQPVDLKRWTGKSVQAFFLRLDSLHPIAGGNKWYKLKEFLAEANRLGADNLVTYGGAYSNHLLATAVVAKEMGLKATGVVRGRVEKSNRVMEMCKQAGMQLVSVSRKEYKQLKNLSGLQEVSTYHIPEGGNGDLGIKGIADMVDYRWTNFDQIAISAGTGTTYLGLSQAPGLKHIMFHVFWAIKGVEPTADARVKHHVNGHRGGFGKVDEELISFSYDFYKETDILLDPVYTSKMVMSLVKHWKSNKLNPDQRWLLVHSGGWTGWLSERNLNMLD